MFCGKCGAENPEDAAFCGKCGADLASPAPSEPMSARESTVMQPMEERKAMVSFQLSVGPILRYLAYAAAGCFVIAGICSAAQSGHFNGAIRASWLFVYFGQAAFYGGLLYAFSYLVPWLLELKRAEGKTE